MAGQTIQDRLLAARHSLAGQGLAKSVCKATTEELIGPKKKHLDCEYILVTDIITEITIIHYLKLATTIEIIIYRNGKSWLIISLYVIECNTT